MPQSATRKSAKPDKKHWWTILSTTISFAQNTRVRIASSHRDNSKIQLMLQVLYLVLHGLDSRLSVTVMAIQYVVCDIRFICPLTQ